MISLEELRNLISNDDNIQQYVTQFFRNRTDRNRNLVIGAINEASFLQALIRKRLFVNRQKLIVYEQNGHQRSN